MAHAHDHSEHSHGIGQVHGDTSNKTRVLIAAVLTAGFMVAEAIGGVITGSLALLADAGHMLTDSISLVLAWYAFHLGARAATSRMTYGFDRVKTLVAFVNGLTVFAIAAWIIYEAWERFGSPSPVLGGPMLIIALIGLAINIAAFFVLNGGDREHLNMRGAILHVLGDLLGSVAAIVAALVILWTGWYPIDPILSVLVALLLFRSAYALVRESGALLLEGAPTSLDRDVIARDIEANVENVREVHYMHVWSLDGSKNMATLHACLKDDAKPYETVAAIKKLLATKHNIAHTTVEPEFGACADAGKEDDHDHGDHDHAGHDHGHDHSGNDHTGHDLPLMAMILHMTTAIPLASLVTVTRACRQLWIGRGASQISAAACIMLGFGLFAYFLPTIMLAVGNYSTVAAGVIAVAFVAAFFLVFWLRGRARGG